MVQHTQTICCQQLTNCLSAFDHFVGLMLKRLRLVVNYFVRHTQYGPINLTQKWQWCFDLSDGIVGALLMYLSKAYACVNHHLIIAKLDTYGIKTI